MALDDIIYDVWKIMLMILSISDDIIYDVWEIMLMINANELINFLLLQSPILPLRIQFEDNFILVDNCFPHVNYT